MTSRVTRSQTRRPLKHDVITIRSRPLAAEIDIKDQNKASEPRRKLTVSKTITSVQTPKSIVSQRTSVEYLDSSSFAALQSRHLSPEAISLLRSKQRRLRDGSSQVSQYLATLERTHRKKKRSQREQQHSTSLGWAVSATLIFASEFAGTAVCVAPEGLIVTCAHCIAETRKEFNSARKGPIWLIFAASGDAVAATCLAWDNRRDLALLQITHAASGKQNTLAVSKKDDGEKPSQTVNDPNVIVMSDDEDSILTSTPTPAQETLEPFPFAHFSSVPATLDEKLICIGQPGTEDFEAAEAGLPTGYEVVHLSRGTFHGIDDGQNVQDNREIGALKHDCWTYWGHSGAPLLRASDGALLGIHSSWDDETGMRRGVAWEAVSAFLAEHAPYVLEPRVEEEGEISKIADHS